MLQHYRRSLLSAIRDLHAAIRGPRGLHLPEAAVDMPSAHELAASKQQLVDQHSLTLEFSATHQDYF